MGSWSGSEALVLVVAGDRDERDGLRREVSAVARAESFADPAQAFERLQHGEVDLVLVSTRNPLGLGFVERLRREHPSVPFTLLVSPGELAEAADQIEDDCGELLVWPAPVRHLRQRVSRAIELHQLREERRALSERLHIEEACRVLASCIDAGKAYPVALDLLLEATSRSRGFALFHRPAFLRGDGVAFRGLSETEARQLRSTFVDDKPLELAGFRDVECVSSGEVIEALRTCGIRDERLLAVPLRGERDLSGVVWLFEDGRSFSPEELARARTIALHGTIAVHNSERYERAQEEAFVDDVTEAFNARYLIEQTDRELVRAERYGNPLSVLFLDLDRFKLVNDRYGHLVGSESLRELSGILRQCVREPDTLARYGGDEFTLLLVDTAHDEALAIARRIRRTVEEHVFESAHEASLRLTISIGVATYPEHGAERGPLLDAADKAMYRAKSQGRNRVCSAGDPVPESGNGS